MSEIKESPSVCVVCSVSIDPDDVIFTDYSDALCNECVQVCQRCDWIGSVNDDFHLVNGDQTWCDGCTENRAYWCGSCEEYNSWGTTYITDRGEDWCEGCLSGNTYYCEDCDEYTADGCDSCVSSRVIHDYSYRPDAIFHSNDRSEKLYFGIEIEVESGRTYDVNDSAEYAHRLETLDLAYLKHDGSLRNGYEIVTHPMSHDFYKNNATEFWDTLERLRSFYKVKSWDTNTCGLHIHISRAGFSNGAHMHNFLNLVYSNQKFYETMAGRSSDQWAKFTDIIYKDYERDAEGNVIRDGGDDYWNPARIIETRQFKHKLSGGHSDRYSAVNTNNYNTLEMRIFRGTVNSDTVKAHLDLAHASVEYTRTLNSNAVIAGALLVENFITYIELNQELYPHLCDRIVKLMPSVGLTRQNVSI